MAKSIQAFINGLETISARLSSGSAKTQIDNLIISWKSLLDSVNSKKTIQESL